MPTYDYQCDACGHKFEEYQSFSADPLKVCPVCKDEKLRRLFGTGAAILFKGSGFYQTDYRSDSYQSGAKADEKSAKPAEKPAGSGDSAAKSEPAKSESAKPDSSAN